MCSIDSRSDRNAVDQNALTAEGTNDAGTVAETNTSMTSAQTLWKHKVALSFGRAVDSYEQHASVQKQVADKLLECIRTETPSTGIDHALEIGCGSGFLTRQLLSEFPNTDWTISDASQQMVEHCRNHPQLRVEQNSNTRFMQLDGELIHNAGFTRPQFDLICSSLAFQWFVDLPNTMNQLIEHLKPGGWLFFSTLDSNNFTQLVEQFPELASRVNKHLSESVLHETLARHEDTAFEVTRLSYDIKFPTLRDLVHSLTAIGAGVSQTEDAERTGSVKDLRAALRRSKLANESVIADYRVLLVAAKKNH